MSQSIPTETRAGFVIQVKYGGRFFRSRTEARWAVLFTQLRLRFEYEVETYRLHDRLYLPDFWMPDLKTWLEVKASTERSSAHVHVATLSELQRLTHAHHAYVAFGSPDLINSNFIVSDCCVYKYFTQSGATHEYPNETVADAYRAAMAERFDWRR